MAKQRKLHPDYQIAHPVQLGTNMIFKAIHAPTGKAVGQLEISGKPSSERATAGFHHIHAADVNMGHQGKGVYGALLAAASGHVKQNGANGLYSPGHFRSEAATGAWAKVPGKKASPGLEGTQDFRLHEEEMAKAHPVPAMPNLGVDDRKETPIISQEQVPLKHRLMANQHMYGDDTTAARLRPAVARNMAHELDKEGRASGRTGVAGVPSTVSYAVNRNPENTASKQPMRTKLHEDTHLMFQQVHKKYGASGALRLAINLYNAIPGEHRAHMRAFVNSKYAAQRYPTNAAATAGASKHADQLDVVQTPHKEKIPGSLPPQHWHEEHLAHLISYVNDPEVRQDFHKRIAGHTSPAHGGLTDKGQGFHSKMKQAYRYFQQASRKANPSWTKRIINHSEADKLHKSMDWIPSKADEAAVMDMLHTFHDGLPEFEAAKFMSNQKTPTQEETEAALAEHEGNYESAALMAHGIEVNPENLRILRKIMDMQELSKAEPGEFDVAIIPRTVQAFNNGAMFVADLVRDAFANNEVRPVKLGGKHSAGTALVKNPEDGILWLLKPGAGKVSPAMGANEEFASQSRREVAFNQVASVMGLGKYVPRSALILLDDVEVAALEFFSQGYEPVERVQKNKDRKLDEIFGKFVDNGLIYKWAAMDYLLGQPDRHAGNIMIDEGDNIRFIDAGSAFCGSSFAPGSDPKSFVPFYLRVFTPRKFNTLTPQERFNVTPSLKADSDQALKAWVDAINEGQIVSILNQFNINPQPFVDRLNALRYYAGPKSEFLRKFYSNLMIGR